MVKRALLIAALVMPQMASAADWHHQPARHHHFAKRSIRYVEQNHVVSCTTTNFVLFSYSSCGQGFDPMAIAGY